MAKLLRYSIVLLGCFALAAQYYLIISNRVVSVAETTIRYFSYFTILTNLLVTITFIREIIRPVRTSVFTAVAVYITVVGAVYQVILRGLWQPAGLQKLVDELLHTILPLLVLVYWFLYKRKGNLSYQNVPLWLLYPLCYLGYILLRGSFSGFYPYPFVDVAQLGYSSVLRNSLLLTLGFVVLSVLFIRIGKFRRQHS